MTQKENEMNWQNKFRVCSGQKHAILKGCINFQKRVLKKKVKKTRTSTPVTNLLR